MKLTRNRPGSRKLKHRFICVQATGYEYSPVLKRYASFSDPAVNEHHAFRQIRCRTLRAFKRQIRNHPELKTFPDVWLVHEGWGHVYWSRRASI